MSMKSWLHHSLTLHVAVTSRILFNLLRPILNRRPFADDIFKCIFLNENERILPRIPLKFVPKVRINNIPALVQIMASRRSGNKPLSEPMMVSLLTHICLTQPQWFNRRTLLQTSRWHQIRYIKHTEADTKWQPFSKHFQLRFSWVKTYEFRLRFH